MSFDEHAAEIVREISVIGVPKYMVEGITEYVLLGREPGDFVQAIFANDLVRAAAAADITNQSCLLQYARLLCLMPGGCWGSPDHIRKWIKRGGLRGAYAETDLTMTTEETK